MINGVSIQRRDTVSILWIRPESIHHLIAEAGGSLHPFQAHRTLLAQQASLLHVPPALPRGLRPAGTALAQSYRLSFCQP